MNNLRFSFYILLLCLLSCGENEKKFDNQGNLDAVSIDSKSAVQEDLTLKKAKTQAQIFPDTTVNNKLRLSNPESILRLYSGKVKILEKVRESPVVVFTNKDNSEYLIAYQYEGGIKNSYDCFEFGFLKDDESLAGIFKLRTSEIKFSTESEISLGLSSNEIINIKGLDYKTETNKNVTSRLVS